MKNWSASVTAVCTPFEDSFAIDETAFSKLLDFLWRNGTRTVLVAGTTGEFFSLSPEERIQLLRVAKKTFPGTVLFHAGSDNLSTTVDLALRGQDLGADAIVALPPYYYADVTPRGIIEWFTAIGRAIQLPLVLYNFPRHTQVALTEDILHAIPHYALKDSSRTLSLIAHTPRYYVGGDRVIEQAFKAGGKGFVSGLSSALPRLFSSAGIAFDAGDAAALAGLQPTIDTVSSVFSGAAMIPKIKYAIAQKVRAFPVHMRPPLVPVSPEESGEVDRALQILGGNEAARDKPAD